MGVGVWRLEWVNCLYAHSHLRLRYADHETKHRRSGPRSQGEEGLGQYWGGMDWVQIPGPDSKYRTVIFGVIYIHTYIHTYVHACMHTHMHADACMHTHTHTHTHTYTYKNKYIN